MIGARGAAILTGVVLMVVGALGMTGTIPSLSVVCATGCNYVTPGFSASVGGANNLTIYAQDTSTILATNLTVQYEQFIWTYTSTGAMGANAITHFHNTVAYATGKAGNWTLTQNIFWTQSGKSGETSGWAIIYAGKGCTAGCAYGGGSVSPSFTTSVSGTTVTVKDKTAVTGLATIQQMALAWGDGSSLNQYATGFSVTHTYAADGVYGINETVAWTVTGSPTVQQTTYAQQVSLLGTPGNITASFSLVATGYNVTLHDTSTSIGSPSIQSVYITWGDGAAVTMPSALGFTVSHLYVSAGTFTVSETITWNPGAVRTSVYQDPVTVPSSYVQTKGNVVQSPTTGGTVNLLTTGLVVAGLALVIFVLIPMPVTWRIAGFVTLTVVGMVVGYFIGGPGPL